MKRLTISFACVIALILASVAGAGTLDDVKTRGYLKAGVNGDLFGFSKPDKNGKWKGLDVDAAKAVAAAVFGDVTKVKFTALTAVQRLPAVQSGEVDVLLPQHHPDSVQRDQKRP